MSDSQIRDSIESLRKIIVREKPVDLEEEKIQSLIITGLYLLQSALLDLRRVADAAERLASTVRD